MIKSFQDDATADIYNGVKSKSARMRLNPRLHPIAQRKLDMLEAARELKDLKAPPSNRLEMLKGALSGKYSIRINDQYRIVFYWKGECAEDVDIIDYH